MLLEFVRRMPFQPWHPPPANRLELRALARLIDTLTRQRTADINRLGAAQATLQTPKIVLDDLASGIEALTQRIDRLLDEAVRMAHADPELAELLGCLTSVKGIADKSGILLLAELALLPTDMSPREVVAYAGLDPRPQESGKKVGRRTISRVGSAHIRAALFMPALSASVYEPSVRVFYQRVVARNPDAKLIAVTAVMRKLLHVLWVMLLTRARFDGERFGKNIAVAA